MKILYLINQYPSISHTFIRREIQSLERLGMPVERVTIRKSAVGVFDEADIEELGCTKVILDERYFQIIFSVLKVIVCNPVKFFAALKEVIFLGRYEIIRILKYLCYLAEACVLLIWVKKSNCNHVHSHFGTNATAVALLCFKLGGPKYSFTVHGSEEFDSPIGLSLKEKIENAHFVIAISYYCKAQLMRWANYTSWSKIHIVRCTVDSRYIDGDVTPSCDNNRLIFVGRLCKEKGLSLLLDALKILSEKDIDFEMILVGDGELRPVLEEQIKEFGLKNKVSIAGWKREGDVKKIISGGRAFVLPSFAEGLPVVIMEALALKRPVVCTYIAGVPELIDEKCGRLVPAGSRVKLATAIEDILKLTESDLVEMGKVGAERVCACHNDNVEAKKLYSLFQSIG